jgi:hypothetical protein
VVWSRLDGKLRVRHHGTLFTYHEEILEMLVLATIESILLEEGIEQGLVVALDS